MSERSPVSSAPDGVLAESPGPFTPGPFTRGTLGRRLVIRVTALVALVAITMILATALATRMALLRQIDTTLDGVANRSQRFDPRGQQGPSRQLQVSGQPIRSLAAVFAAGGVSTGQLLTEDQGPVPLSGAVLDELSEITTGPDQHSVRLSGLGNYRIVGSDVLVSVDRGPGQPGRAYWGISLAEADRTLVNLLGLEALLGLVAIIGAAVGARTVVIRSLRPLNRVAATAQQVSQLPLDRGEVALAVRVAPEDADPTSEVGRVGSALNHLLTNVEEALAVRQASEVKVRQFVADASHELRNPLAAIRGYAELTRRSRADMDQDTAYALERVESEADRMSHLVDDLLLLARLDSGPSLDISAVDLSEIVLNAVSDARASGPDYRWQMALPSEPVLALGDRHRLHQVVSNLLTNARTHTPPGTRVETSVSINSDRAFLTVIDDGPGIPVELQTQVFERFTRADTSRVRVWGNGSGASTGLGLAIVAAVIEGHHGTVSVESRPGHTAFVLTLPLAATADGTPG